MNQPTSPLATRKVAGEHAPFMVYPGRGNTDGFGLGPMFETIIEARWHAIGAGWPLYRFGGELLAITPRGMAQIARAQTGTPAFWWVHSELVA